MKAIKNTFYNSNIKGYYIVIDDNGLLVKDDFLNEDDANNYITEKLLSDLKNIVMPEVKEIGWQTGP